MSQLEKRKLTVIGGGLVGSLNACLYGKLGYPVELYEAREDIRQAKHVKGKSINMALSTRGLAALKLVELDKIVANNGIPMYARMIHNRDGSTYPVPYGRGGQAIISIDRRRLNEILLSGAESYTNVQLNFEHKLKSVDALTNKIELELKQSDKEIKICDFETILACDGAYSTSRRELNKVVRLNFSQQYISHGYMELCISETGNNEFAMAENYLHIWPRHEYMMIALPNLDKSFTVTLFMPFDIFESLTTSELLIEFFEMNFADSLPLLGREDLISAFFSSKPLPLISVKCKPYHYEDKLILLGDAAHAMVPFYGQGMNAGFEDCSVLHRLLVENEYDFKKTFSQYTDCRYKDAIAICNLAMYNYIEMRSSVNSIFFLLRKKVDFLLNRLFPRKWIPLYSSVAFSRMPYSKCVSNRKWQDKLLNNLGYLSFVTGLVLVTFFTRKLLTLSK